MTVSTIAQWIDEESRARPWVKQAAMVAILVAAVWLPRTWQIGQYVTIDEHPWLTNSANFYRALYNRDFGGTYQREHPGVTTMWAGTAGFLAVFPDYVRSDPGVMDKWQIEAFLLQNGHSALEVLVASRFFVVAAITLVLLVSWTYAYRQLGPLPAFVGFLMIGLDPFYIGHTQLLHQDGLLSAFMLLSLLSFLGYVQTRRRRDLVVSGVAAGLSWLTKTPGLFLIPAIGLIALADPVWLAQERSEAAIWRRLGAFALWGAVGCLVSVALWPAMWLAPLQTLSKVAAGALGYAEAGHESPLFFNGRILLDGRLGPAFYPISYLWRTTPVILTGLGANLVVTFRRGRQLGQREWFTLMGLLLFIALFTLQLTLSYKKFDRYLLPVYAPLALLAAVGWSGIAHWLAGWIRSGSARMVVALFLGLVIAVQGLAALQVFPYYLSYYNPLAGGAAKAPEVMTVGWGEGLDQAAAYLNNKPEAATLRVASWYGPTFSYYFKGVTVNIDNAADISQERLQGFLGADYLVAYVHQWQRQIPKSMMDRLAVETPAHVVRINGIDYAFIYDLRGMASR